MNKDILTGNTGKAVQDGSVRGAIIALMNIAILLLSTEISISDEQLTLILAAINPIAIVLFGVYDRFR